MGTNFTDTVTCANCGMEIAPGMAVGSQERDGETLYFCSEACETAFADRPSEDTSHQSM